MSVVCLAITCLAQGAEPEGLGGLEHKSHGAGRILQPLDRIEIRVQREPQLSDVYTVSPSGTISFPLVGEVQVAGRKTAEVAGEIEQRLAAYLRRPEVEAEPVAVDRPAAGVSEPSPVAGGYTVYISGAVRAPGAYAVNEPITPLQLIVRAGGLDNVLDSAQATDGAGGEVAKIYPDLKRVSLIGGQGDVEIVDLSEMGQRDLDLKPLHPGDTVIVPGHTGGTYAIYGWVGRPGVYTLSQPILLSEALARGVPDNRFADLTRVKMIRGDPQNPETLTVNLDRLHARKEVELLPVVHPGDTIYVPRNLFSRLPFVPWISASARAR